MQSSARDSYLEAQVLTATPQRLRLLLLEAAVRFTRQLQEALSEERTSDAVLASDRARQIVAELLGSVERDGTELTQRVIAIYAYLYQRLANAAADGDSESLREIIDLLEYECETWRLVCGQSAAGCSDALRQDESAVSPGSLLLDA